MRFLIVVAMHGLLVPSVRHSFKQSKLGMNAVDYKHFHYTGQ